MQADLYRRGESQQIGVSKQGGGKQIDGSRQEWQQAEMGKQAGGGGSKQGQASRGGSKMGGDQSGAGVSRVGSRWQEAS